MNAKFEGLIGKYSVKSVNQSKTPIFRNDIVKDPVFRISVAFNSYDFQKL